MRRDFETKFQIPVKTPISATRVSRFCRISPRSIGSPFGVARSLVPCVMGAVLFACATPAASARSGETSWTSVDGVTIWARLVGWDGSNVIIFRNGRDYKVPVSRLTPESADKARVLLGLAAKNPAAAAIAGDPRRGDRGVNDAVAEGAGRPAAPIPAAGGRESGFDTRLEPDRNPLPDDTLAAMPAPAELATAELPDWSKAVEVASASFGSVLPEREPAILPVAPPVAESAWIRLEGGRAIAPASAPSLVKTAIAAANHLQTKPYKWGGGHGRTEDSGYDCSGSVSYVLMKAGLLRSPGTSRSLMKYGEAGPGRWITIYARNGHAFMTICGLRLDTGGHAGRGESGPRWRPNGRGGSGFVMRHPPGL
jgi:cell wall-associated NlpC family hydrolase